MRAYARLKEKGLRALAAATVCLAMLPTAAFATTWDRLAGGGAYDTMQKVVRTNDTFNASNTDTVVIATGDSYWDALSASGLAGKLQAPVLITPTNSLCEQTRSELERLKPSRAIVMGGKLAVSEEVLSAIEDYCDTVDRVWGGGASQTAVAAWREGSNWSDTAIVATTNGYYDALSIAPYAYAKNAPIFLTDSDTTLNEATLSAIREGGFKRVAIVGGKLAVSPKVEEQLAGIETFRLAGENAIVTSAEIARWEMDQGMRGEGMCVATIRGYWDALTGAAFAGKNNAVLALVETYRYDAVDAAIDKAGANNVSHGYVFGGPLAVSDSAFSYLRGGAGAARKAAGIELALHDSFAHDEKPQSHQKYIMMHDTEEEMEPAGIVQMWLGRNGGQIATHFVVGRDGSILQCIPLDRVGYHAGNGAAGSLERFGIEGRTDSDGDWGMNSWSVGIEICHVGTPAMGYPVETSYPKAQLEALDRLVAYIDAYYGFEADIIDHKTWTPGNPDCSAEFDGYLANYQRTRTHDGHQR